MIQYSQNKGTEQAFQSTGSEAAGAVQGLRETTGNSIKYMEDKDMKKLFDVMDIETGELLVWDVCWEDARQWVLDQNEYKFVDCKHRPAWVPDNCIAVATEIFFQIGII